MELEIRHKAEMQELQVKVDLKELEWRGALQSKDDEHAKELEALKVEKRKVARQAEVSTPFLIASCRQEPWRRPRSSTRSAWKRSTERSTHSAT